MRTLSASLFLAFAVIFVSSLFSRNAVDAFGIFDAPVVRNGPAAPAQLELHDSLFTKIAAAIVPVINQVAKNISIPGESSDHYKFDTIHIDDFNLGPVTFGFTAPGKISVSLSSLGFAIPSTGFELMDKILFVHVHCSGHADGQVLISADFSFDLVDKDGKLALDGSTAVNIDYKNFHIGISMDHEVCKIAEKFINFITGGITNKVKDAVEKNLGPAIQKALTESLTKAFTRLPVGVTGNPSVTNGVLSVPIDLDTLVHSTEMPPRRSLQVAAAAGNIRDVELIVPETSANTVLQTVTNDGKFHFNHTTKKLTTSVFKSIIPEAYSKCPDCHLKITVDIARIAPALSFANNNMSLTARNVSLGFFAVDSNNTNRVIPLFVLNMDGGFSLGQFAVSQNTTYQTIKFQLGVEKIDLSVISSNVGVITDITVVNWLINFVAETVIGIFNSAFDGIPIPETGFTVSDILIAINDRSASAGFDVSI